MDDLNDLLDHINELHEKHKGKERFNVFYSLGFRTQETMHSKFISTLLDPKDQHERKNHFLKL